MSFLVSEHAVGYALKQQRMTAAEFLDWDATQTLKHEFVGGEVYAMAGGEDRNNTVALNLVVALRQHLHGSACRVYASDMKLRVEAVDSFFYPDLMVTCSPADAADRLIKHEPVLVIEVLSPGTAAFDRGEKFASYRQLPSPAQTRWSTWIRGAAICFASRRPTVSGCCTPVPRAKRCKRTAWA